MIGNVKLNRAIPRQESQRRLAICNVRLSMYICRVAFPDDSLSVSFSAILTRSNSTAKL